MCDLLKAMDGKARKPGKKAKLNILSRRIVDGEGFDLRTAFPGSSMTQEKMDLSWA